MQYFNHRLFVLLLVPCQSRLEFNNNYSKLAYVQLLDSEEELSRPTTNNQSPPLCVTHVHGQHPTHVDFILVPTPIVLSPTPGFLPPRAWSIDSPSAHPLLVPCTFITCPSSPPLSHVSTTTPVLLAPSDVFSHLPDQ